jgi:hypothetical protein
MAMGDVLADPAARMRAVATIGRHKEPALTYGRGPVA